MCNCAKLPTLLDGDDEKEPFKSMTYICTVPDQYAIIMLCQDCKQNWWVSGADKYSSGLCIKIDAFDDVKEINIEEYKYAKIIKNYDGLSDKKCIYQGCTNKGMNKLVFCPQCAIEKNHITS